MILIFRRYQKVLWSVLAVVVIITFVFWGSQTGSGPTQRRESPGKMYGKNVSFDDFKRNYWGEYLMYYLQTGQRPDTGRMSQQLERDTWYRMMLVRKIGELGLYVPEETAVDFVQRLPIFQRDGQFDQTRYIDFTKGFLPSIPFTETDFLNIIREQVGVEKLRDIIVGTAKVTKLEVQQAFEEKSEKLGIAVVAFNATNYLAQVKITDKDIQDEFDKNKEAYRIPDRVKVRYVKIGTDAFLPKVTVTDAEIKERYDKHKEAFTDPKTKKVKPLDAVREQLKKEIAVPKAMQQVRELAEKINDEVLPDPRNPQEKRPDLPTVAKQYGLALADTDYFTEQDELKFISAPNFQRAAFSLKADNPYELVPAPDGVYFIQFVDRKPSELPVLAAVREKIVKNLTHAKSLELAGKDGREKHDKFKAALEATLAAGKVKPTLDQLATAPGLKVITPKPFGAEEPPAELPYVRLIERACLSLAPGELSDFIETAEGGLLVQLKQRIAPDAKELAAHEKELRNKLLDGERMFGFGQPGKRSMAFNLWLEAQAREANMEPVNTRRGSSQAGPEE